MTKPFDAAAYGGAGWSPRTTSLRREMGTVWGPCGVATEWAPLRAVLLHRPGAELEAVSDPDQVQMLAPLDAARVEIAPGGLVRVQTPPHPRTGKTEQLLDPVDFVHVVVSQVPDRGRHLVRYYGVYSNRSRKQWRERIG